MPGDKVRTSAELQGEKKGFSRDPSAHVKPPSWRSGGSALPPSVAERRWSSSAATLVLQQLPTVNQENCHPERTPGTPNRATNRSVASVRTKAKMNN